MAKSTTSQPGGSPSKLVSSEVRQSTNGPYTVYTVDFEGAELIATGAYHGVPKNTTTAMTVGSFRLRDGTIVRCGQTYALGSGQDPKKSFFEVTSDGSKGKRLGYCNGLTQEHIQAIKKAAKPAQREAAALDAEFAYLNKEAQD